MVSAAVASGCPVAAVTAAGSNLYLQQHPAATQQQQQVQQQQPRSTDLTAVAVPFHATGWTTADGQPTELCPYATFALPTATSANTADDGTSAVTLKLHPHAEIFGTLCR